MHNCIGKFGKQEGNKPCKIRIGVWEIIRLWYKELDESVK